MPPKPGQTSKSVPKGSSKSYLKGKKAKPKQPLSTQDRLKRLFTSLCAQIDGGHFHNAIKTCDKILVLDPLDVDATQTKLFLLLQIEQYSVALALIDSGKDPEKYAYERAYTLYRMQREHEAKDVLQDLKKAKGEEDRGIAHLEAQLNYREGLYQEAFDLYNQLLDTAEPNTEEHSDILTNLQASQKHLDFINAGFHHALSSLPSSVTTTLETAPPPVHQPTLAAVTSASAPVEREEPKLAPKKVRMRRVPAGVVPGVTPLPDPERWLKKSERSSFHQGKRRKGAGGGATQGAAVEAAPTPGGGTTHTSKTKGKKKK